MTDRAPIVESRPLVIGHRGTEDCPENTLSSFRQSLAQGADMLELDVRLTRDHVAVVIHDSSLRRVTGGCPGSIARRTLKHIQSLDVGGDRIPTLKEALTELCPRAPVNIELKFVRPDYRPLACEVARVIGELGVNRRVLVSSFWHPSLRVVARRLPGVLTGRLFGRFTGPPHEEDLEDLCQEPLRDPEPGHVPLRGRVLICCFDMVGEELIRRVRAIDGTIVAYTVDRPEDMVRMIRLGVDAIITNRPGLLRATMTGLGVNPSTTGPPALRQDGSFHEPGVLAAPGHPGSPGPLQRGSTHHSSWKDPPN